VSAAGGAAGRIGIFGGTFDPPHHGHLIAAADAFHALELDRLLLVPASVPPHKPATGRTSAALRLEMLRAAVAGDRRFEVDDLELRREGPSYTVDTLRELTQRFEGCELFLLIGADMARDLHTWREPAEIARLARLTVLARAGDQPQPAGGLAALSVPVTRVDISATEVRRRVAAGEPVRYLVPDAVKQIIEREGLYR
jgi:nicotinate-nucleotide adenylyltransferase